MNLGSVAALALLETHQRDPSKTLLCVVPNMDIADGLTRDIRTLTACYPVPGTPNICGFPPWRLSSFVTEESQTAAGRRNWCQYQHIFSDPKPLVFTTLEALGSRCPSDTSLARFFHQISVGDALSVQGANDLCVSLGFDRQDLVDEMGTFAVRGFVVDCFSPSNNMPVRMTFCGDEVEQLQTFNLYSQQTESDLEHVVLVSPRLFHYHEVQRSLEFEINKVPIPIQRKYQIIDALRAGVFFEEADLLEIGCSPDFVFPDLFFKDARPVILDSQRCVDQFSPPFDQKAQPSHIPISRSPFVAHFKNEAAAIVGSMAWRELDLDEILGVHRIQDLPFDSDNPSGFFKQWFPKWQRKQGRVFFCHQSHLHLQKLLKYLETPEGIPPEAELISGSLSRSFVDRTKRRACVRVQDLFGGADVIEIADQAKVKRFFSTLKTLEEGDLVIHTQHGIARYLGLQHIVVGDVSTEFIALEFAHQDKLFVPIYRLHLVQKYVTQSPSTSLPLDSLRDRKFQKRKQKLQERITKFAHEIVEVQAKRELTKTEAFGPVEGEELFAQAFPFDETEDQLTSIQEVLNDLEKTIPMDRLLCGDVGFGKTEVAFRAVFRVLSRGKQAALLTPTTLLAHQHYRTAVDRFAKYPFRFDVLSRFRSTKEQKQIVADLRDGKIDCIIGTHRLLQKDVGFSDLGFVVVDEEQKFGVKHKEQLKRFRVQTHTLSLSATPIPRTLNLALSGMRHLSLLSTPPTDRLPIHTNIAKHDPRVLKDAFGRELARSGQVFVVVPRVLDIPDVETWIQRHIPEVRYGVAHGQMPEAELENIMVDFYEQRFPVLVSTTIIESGLDVPTANTMVVFRPHIFGLSQLYQLRGRIGRSKRQAFCYLVLPRRENVSKLAQKRLSALLRYHDLGGGFQVANYDLEVRGAGNVLGKEQTGFLHDIGAELYFELLKEAIDRLQGKDVVHLDPEIVWDWESVIPEGYLPSIPLRLEIYQNLSKAGDKPTLHRDLESLENRFGPAPPQVLNLVQLHVVRLFCVRMGIAHFQYRRPRLELTFVDQPPVDIKAVIGFLQNRGAPFQFRSAHQLSIMVDTPEPTTLNEFLEALGRVGKRED